MPSRCPEKAGSEPAFFLVPRARRPVAALRVKTGAHDAALFASPTVAMPTRMRSNETSA
jgi:hypothetical protein